MPSAASVAREYIHDSNSVWVMAPGGSLAIRPVEIAFRGTHHVLITGGLEPGEQLVTTDITAPVEGMALSTAGAGKGRLAEMETSIKGDPS